ncbi:MAG: T9SS type A sorting domain-containing protein, partial [Flavobacteriales bacterium]|nr:T9SS type A sorting domain-containing protein [Flavobacteriales bacterium]
HQAFSQDCFLARYNGIAAPVGVNEVHGAPRMALYPEPSNGSFTLAVDDALSGGRYTIADLGGRAFAEGTVQRTLTEQRFDLPSGAYLITLVKDNARVSRRFTVVR